VIFECGDCGCKSTRQDKIRRHQDESCFYNENAKKYYCSNDCGFVTLYERNVTSHEKICGGEVRHDFTLENVYDDLNNQDDIGTPFSVYLISAGDLILQGNSNQEEDYIGTATFYRPLYHLLEADEANDEIVKQSNKIKFIKKNLNNLKITRIKFSNR